MAVAGLESPSGWDEARDEIDIDTEMDEAFASKQDHRLPPLLQDMIRLVRFQGRIREADEFEAFVPAMDAFARGHFRESLFLVTQELSIQGIEPGMLMDKMLLWLGQRLEERGDQRAALWAYTECEGEEGDAAEDRLQEALDLDEYTTEKTWNEAIFAHYKARTEKDAESADAWEVLALQHTLLDQPDEALAAAKHLLSLDPRRPQAYQTLIEILGGRGDAASLDDLEQSLQDGLRAWPDAAWPHFAMAEFLFVHRGELSQARAQCEAALAIEPTMEDANTLFCTILHKAGDWHGLAAQLEAMIERAADRFQLYDLYDDLAEVADALGDGEKAARAQERAALYNDAWNAADHVLEVFREDRSDPHTWKVLQGLLHETSRWDLLYQTALERLDHEDNNSQIHEIYEDLFMVFQSRMVVPPWKALEAHLEERIAEEESAALRLLLSHHLGWVKDQMKAELDPDATGESSVDAASALVVTEEELHSFARKWSIFIGHPLHEKRMALHFGVFLLALPVGWLLLDGHLEGGVLGILLVGLSIAISAGTGGWLVERLAPEHDRCGLCGQEQWEFHRLSSKASAQRWAQTPPGLAAYWGRCKACGFDSRLVYHPATSGLFRMFMALEEAEDHCEELRWLLHHMIAEEDFEDLPEILFETVKFWNQLHFCEEARPEIFQALRTMLLEELDVLEPLETKAPALFRCWEEERMISFTEEQLLLWSDELSEDPLDLDASLQAVEKFGRLLSLHISHLREQILAVKAG